MGTTEFAPLRISTNDLPERDRLPFWRDFFNRKLLLCEFDAESRNPFHAEATLLAWPGLRVMWSSLSAEASLQRTTEMVAQGDDAICILIKRSGVLVPSQLGVDLALGDGDATVGLHAERAKMKMSEVEHITVVAPRAALVPLVTGLEDAAMRLIPRENDALRLLRKYLGILSEEPPLVTPELRHSVVTHIHDLIATALGATRDAAAIAADRGVAAARLRAVKADILQNLCSPELNVNAVALRHGVTARYVHMLFEREGITFSEFVLGQRLVRAHRMLSDPRFAGMSISTIAYEAGFGDLSYFNRRFQRRFGETPSAVRQRSTEES